jgi:hypothetical protein
MTAGFTELTAPAATLGASSRRSSSRVAWFAATSALLLCCALVALSTQDGSSTEKFVLDELSTLPEGEGGGGTEPGVTDPDAAGAEITADDLAGEQEKVKEDLEAMATEKAGHLTGSVPTDEEEASAIIDGADYIKHMGEPYHNVVRPHSNDAEEADSIIDNANKDNMDVTGKAGADLYAVASDPTAPMSAWMKGSIPNYRESCVYV